MDGLSTHINLNGIYHEVIVTDTSEAGVAVYLVAGVINNPNLSVSETVASNWVGISQDSPTAISGNPEAVGKQQGDALMVGFSNVKHISVKEFRVLFSGVGEGALTDTVVTQAGEQLKTSSIVSNIFDISWFPSNYSTPLISFLEDTKQTPTGTKVNMLKVVANNYSAVSKQESFKLDTTGKLDTKELFEEKKVDTAITSINGNVAFGMSVNSKDGDTSALLLGGRNGSPVRIDRLHKIGLGEI